MSIVSRKMDSFLGGGRTYANREIAPNRQSRDYGETPCPEFMMAETLPLQSQSKKIRLPGNPRTNQSLSYVPLKSDQEGTRAEGASLFHAPVSHDISKLAVPQDYARHLDVREMYKETDVRLPPPLNLKRGIRPEPRAMKMDDISENAPPMNRADYDGMGVSRYTMPKVQYSVGENELKRLYGS